MKLVHDYGRDAAEIEGGRVEKAIEQDFGDDHEDASVRVDAPVARHQADIFRLEAPALGAGLHLAEFLLGQGDERRRVVGDLSRVQGLEQCCLGDQGLAHTGRSAHEHALVGGKPGK